MTQKPFEDVFGSFEGACYSCEMFARLNDLALCEECAAKLDRDLIRQRDWDYAMLAYGLPVEHRETLRRDIINTYGAKLELISPEPATGRTRRRKRRRSSRKDTA